MKNTNFAVVAAALLPALANAQETATGSGSAGNAYLAAGICMGLAAAGVGYAQSRAASAALDGIGRNPAAAKNLFVPMILSLALMESLVLLAFVVANGLAGK